MNLLHIWIAIIFLIIMFKLGDWKNWGEYYPTILYMSMGDLIYNFLTKDTKLWQWESPVFTHTFLDILWIFTIFPATVIVFLSNYPNKAKQKLIYILFFIGSYAILEGVLSRLHYIVYHNGWRYLYSILFYFVMFPMLRLHYKRAILAWVLYFIFAFSLLYLFDLPLRILETH